MARMNFGPENPTGNSNSNSPGHMMYGGGSGDGAEPSKRQRSVYTSQQISQLEAFFEINEYIDGERKKQLSRMTNIPEHQIKVWFQNRRQKKKRELEDFQARGSNEFTGNPMDGSASRESLNQQQ